MILVAQRNVATSNEQRENDVAMLKGPHRGRPGQTDCTVFPDYRKVGMTQLVKSTESGYRDSPGDY
jgi:hypothetical protein